MSKGDPKLLIISHAGIKQINRSVFRYLARSFPSVHVVIPESLMLSSGKQITAEVARPDDPPLIRLKLKGRNPRTYTYVGLVDILNRIKPLVVILENDPVSRLGYNLAAWCRKNEAVLLCQSYENFRRGVITSFRQRGIAGVVKSLPIHLLNYIMAKKVDALFVVNRESEKIFKEYGYRNVTRIPLGYEGQIFFTDTVSRNTYRKKLQVTGNEILIAYFGRLVEQKGVHLLVEALAAMRDKPWKLLLDHIHDSSGVYTQRIRKLIDGHNLGDRVLYFEADHLEIANYMRAADIMVAPSITTPDFKEQYGRAVQEAMACGCVCLVSDSGHLKDLVGEKTLIFEENNVNTLRQCLQSMIDDEPGRLIMSKSLTKRALESLTSKNQASIQISLIIGLLNIKRA
jgi:glycosyltransferase involved in cell wall biosynthesis